jgi:3-oxoadipate enol-lactonase
MKKITLRDGLEMAYVEEGNGQPIVLLHGYCGSHHYFDEVIPALSKHGRVIAIDQRGHGATAKSEGKYSMEQLADDLAALLDEQQISQINLFGHSLGGYVALAFAERYPERVLTIGLLHSTSLPDAEAAQENRLKAARAIQEDGVNPFVDGLIPKLFAATNRMNSPEKLMRAVEIGYETSAEGAIGCALGMKDRPDRTAVLEQLDIPILLLAGELDEIITQEKRFPVARDNITALTLSRVAHMGMMEDSEAFSSAIISFLEQSRELGRV